MLLNKGAELIKKMSTKPARDPRRPLTEK